MIPGNFLDIPWTFHDNNIEPIYLTITQSHIIPIPIKPYPPLNLAKI